MHVLYFVLSLMWMINRQKIDTISPAITLNQSIREAGEQVIKQSSGIYVFITVTCNNETQIGSISIIALLINGS